jgi:hypothetical protein
VFLTLSEYGLPFFIPYSIVETTLQLHLKERVPQHVAKGFHPERFYSDLNIIFGP